MTDKGRFSLPGTYPRRRRAVAALALAAVLVGAQAAGAESVPLDAERAALFARFGGAFVEAGGVRTHYFEYGEAGASKTLLFLHGIGGTGLEASSLEAPLEAAGYRVIAPDWPGAGLSDLLPAYGMDALEEWLEAFRAALGLDSFVLVGHSYGGFIAARYAASRPARVERLILMDPAGYRAEIGFFLNTFVELAPAVDAVATLYDPWFYEVVSSIQVYKNRGRAPADMLEYGALSLGTAMGRKGIREIAVDVVGATPDIDCLGSIRAPVLLLWGEDDRVLPYSFHAAFIRALPFGAVFRPIADCGHAPHTEFPDITAADILAFLEPFCEQEPPEVQ